MKTLCVLLLAVLGWSLSQGRNVSVCELTTQLRSAAANYSKLNGSDPNVLAQIVCHADILSNLSTSTQTNETHVFRDAGKGAEGGKNQAGGHSGEKQAGGHSGEKHGHKDKREVGTEAEPEPDPRRRSRSVKGPDRGQTHPGSGSPPSAPQQNCTLHGVVQLSSCQACYDGVTPTKNICKLNCSELLDDDISNDIVCLLKVMFTELKCTNMWQELGESLGKNQKNQSGQCSNVSAYMC